MKEIERTLGRITPNSEEGKKAQLYVDALVNYPEVEKYYGGYSLGDLMLIRQYRKNLLEKNARLAEKEFTAEAAGGKIKVTANGTGMVTALSIDAAVVDPDDVEFLQSLLLKTVQDALNGSKEMAEKEMRKVTGGLGFPM